MSAPEQGSLGTMQAAQKRPVNLSVRGEILGAAREAGVNLSALLERALSAELADLKRRRWHEENVRTVCVYNEFLASNGTCFEGRMDE